MAMIGCVQKEKRPSDAIESSVGLQSNDDLNILQIFGPSQILFLVQGFPNYLVHLFGNGRDEECYLFNLPYDGWII